MLTFLTNIKVYAGTKAEDEMGKPYCKIIAENSKIPIKVDYCKAWYKYK